MTSDKAIVVTKTNTCMCYPVSTYSGSIEAQGEDSDHSHTDYRVCVFGSYSCPTPASSQSKLKVTFYPLYMFKTTTHGSTKTGSRQYPTTPGVLGFGECTRRK